MKFIRVLYGENFEETRPKILKDLKRSFKQNPTFCKESVTYFTMGPEASRLLRNYGAEDVRQFHKEPLMRVMGGTGSWNKIWLLSAALHEFQQPILYTDMDTFPALDTSESSILEEIEAKEGVGAKLLQITVQSYHKNYYSFRSNNKLKGWDRISPKIGVFGCFIFVSSFELLQNFLHDADELEKTRIHPVSDERFITYSIDKRFGEQTLGDYWKNFVPSTGLINPRCSMGKDVIVRNKKPIFKHVR